MADSAPTAPAYYYDIKMTCGGCSGAIDRVLKKKIEAPNAYKVSLEKQAALIWGPSLPALEDLTTAIKKTGKEVRDVKVVDDASAIPAL